MKDYNTMAAMVTTRNHLNFLLNSTNSVRKDQIKSVRVLVGELDAAFLKMVMDENKQESRPMSVTQVTDTYFTLNQEMGAVVVTPFTTEPVGAGVSEPAKLSMTKAEPAKSAKAKAASVQDPDVVAALARKKASKK